MARVPLPKLQVSHVLRCPCGRETLRVERKGTPEEINRWSRAWRELAESGRFRQVCECGAALVLAPDPEGAADVRDERGRGAGRAPFKAKMSIHPGDAGRLKRNEER